MRSKTRNLNFPQEKTAYFVTFSAESWPPNHQKCWLPPHDIHYWKAVENTESLAPMLGGLEVWKSGARFFSTGPDRSGSLPVDCLLTKRHMTTLYPNKNKTRGKSCGYLSLILHPVKVLECKARTPSLGAAAAACASHCKYKQTQTWVHREPWCHGAAQARVPRTMHLHVTSRMHLAIPCWATQGGKQLGNAILGDFRKTLFFYPIAALFVLNFKIIFLVGDIKSLMLNRNLLWCTLNHLRLSHF